MKMKAHKQANCIKKILKNLEDILLTEGFPFVEYLHIIKEVNNMCTAEVFDDNSEILILLKKKCSKKRVYSKKCSKKEIHSKKLLKKAAQKN